jgi:glutamine synthetase
MMRDHGVEIEGYNREHGPGMYEMNIRYANALTAGDRTMLFKTGVKEICHQLGYTATFMAKWNDQEDGSSGHSHMSLWDRDGERNLFWDESAEGYMSATMRSFLAGVLATLPEFMVLYAPTINSYKRYIEGTWAPLNTTWGMDNRTCAVRVINNGRRAIRTRTVCQGLMPISTFGGQRAPAFRHGGEWQLPETSGLLPALRDVAASIFPPQRYRPLLIG